MKTFHTLIWISVLLFALGSCEKEEFEIDEGIETFTFTSGIIQDSYPIYVYLPPTYRNNQPNLLIIGLDGDFRFRSIARLIAEKSAEGSIPPCLFVGVGNTSGRNRDYTPTAYAHGLGGGENYYRFLKEELIPELETRYYVDSTNSKTLIGNSFGGLFTHFALFHDRADNPFDKFISVGCSYWFDSGVIFEYEKDYASQNVDLAVKYYSGMGTLEGGVNLASFDEMTDRLRSRNYPGLKMKVENIEKHGHSGSAVLGFKNGLDYVFAP